METGGQAMSFKIRRVGHLVLRVKDVARSRRFFEEVMGLPVVAQNERGMLFFSTDVEDNHHMVAIMPAKEGAAMPTPDHVGMQHVSFELGTFAELQDAYRRLKEKGVPLDHTTFHGVTKSVYFYDPDGNRFEFYCNVPAEQYLKSVPNPYSRYGAIEDELEGKIPQKPGTVAP
jgi:catechol 2,3-dioxygenase